MVSRVGHLFTYDFKSKIDRASMQIVCKYNNNFKQMIVF
jgi:hypothetical protein